MTDHNPKSCRLSGWPLPRGDILCPTPSIYSSVRPQVHPLKRCLTRCLPAFEPFRALTTRAGCSLPTVLRSFETNTGCQAPCQAAILNLGAQAPTQITHTLTGRGGDHGQEEQEDEKVCSIISHHESSCQCPLGARVRCSAYNLATQSECVLVVPHLLSFPFFPFSFQLSAFHMPSGPRPQRIPAAFSFSSVPLTLPSHLAAAGWDGLGHRATVYIGMRTSLFFWQGIDSCQWKAWSSLINSIQVCERLRAYGERLRYNTS